MSRHKKQSVGVYSRLNANSQEYEQRENRALRRRNKALRRKSNLKAKQAYRKHLETISGLASRIYYE